MAASTEVRAAEMARAVIVKRRNACAAAFTGLLLAAGSLSFYDRLRGPLTILLAFAGVMIGIFYANGFEYVLHRYLLHWGEGFLVQRHALHHDSAGAPNEARYVNFATSPWVVVLVFLLNAPPVLVIGRWVDGGLAAGVFLGFTTYFILYEELHWRIHFGGLPRWMQFARRHHMMHHGGFAGRYNVFLPLFDWLLERREWNRPPAGITNPAAQRRA